MEQSGITGGPQPGSLTQRARVVTGVVDSAGAGSASEGLAKVLLDASVDCVIGIDVGGQIVEWNAAAERTFGWSRAQALGRPLAELVIPPANRPAFRDGLRRWAEARDPRILGHRGGIAGVRANGEEFPVELTVTATPGREPLLVGFVRDVSEEHRLAAERERTQRRRDALSGMGHEVLAGIAFDELLGRIAELAREELGVEACEVWAPEGDGLQLVGHSADGERAPGAPPEIPPPTEGATALADGLAVRIGVLNGGEAVLVLRGGRREGLGEAEVGLAGSLAQLLGAALGRHRSSRELERVEQRYRDLLERLPVVSYLAEYGADGRWLYVSPQVEQLLGYPVSAWLDEADFWERLLHPDDLPWVLAEEERCARTLEPLCMEYRMFARDGRVVWVRDEGAYGKPVADGRVRVEGVLTDITEKKRAEEALRYRAEHDDLTGLANRRGFENELHRRRGAGEPLGAVAILDIDSLKFVNDSLGHAAGDAVVRAVASSLSRVLEGDEFLARFGGDEFALMLSAYPREELLARLNLLVRTVRTRESRLPVTISAGAVLTDEAKAASDADLVIAADIATREAKERGGDRVALFSGGEKERLAWVEHVRSAIDEGRLVLHAQPIFAMGGEEVASELLVRMIDEDGAVLPPSAFLPTAERFGLIRELDHWVVARAVELATLGRSVTVNLSARSIADPALTRELAAAIERTGADPARLIFEITETAATTAIEDLQEFGAQVERLGCALAIDDFGTGFGSLTYLRHLPVRFLKVDMEFVRGMTESAADRAIVHSIVTIAKALGIHTVAEGVEDEDTLEELRRHDVDFAQGYHLGRPGPLAAAK